MKLNKRGELKKKRKSTAALLVCVCMLMFIFAGCGSNTAEEDFVETTETESGGTGETESAGTDQSNSGGTASAYDFGDDLPTYEGEAYTEWNGNIPSFSDEEKARTDYFETYSKLDELGRCGVAFGNICPESLPTEARGEIGDIRPSGWQTVKYSDLIDGNYLYNRCHLIAYSLAGENANEKNLITGTRYMNIEGMQPFEIQVVRYVESTGNHVLYRVTPIFEGDNLVASGVEMEAWSVEDEGEGVCFHVYCFNVQPGITIDYLTGDSEVAEDSLNRSHVHDTADDANDLYAEASYILNTNTKKFHLPSCSSVKDMSERNKEAFSGTIEEAIAQGYSPCQRCLKSY